MSINLGLSRVAKLLSYIGNPHERLRVLHVAGTNGKGSVCSYLSSILQDKSSRIGKFTTPHLIEVTDSITIDNRPISWDAYTRIRKSLEAINVTHHLKCTEFELLTCTAFQYFHDVNCQWCVIEVGLGGRLDATNVIPGHRKIACGLTKISLDHESFLGNTLAKIAQEKAGIITNGVKFAIVDGSNDKSVIQAIEEKCATVGCQLTVTEPDSETNYVDTKSWGRLVLDKLPLNGRYQICNLRVALAIIDCIQQRKLVELSAGVLLDRLKSVEWPGRLQNLDFCYDPVKKCTIPLILDGAHNGSAAIELARFLRKQYGDLPLSIVIAVTSGKNLETLLGPLLRQQDKVIVTEYGKVDGMPWINPMNASELSAHVTKNYTKNVEVQPDLSQLVSRMLEERRTKRPLVVCGSLYLCGDILRLDRRNREQ